MADTEVQNIQDTSAETKVEETTPKESEPEQQQTENKELDPRGKQIEEKILALINSAQGIWKDAFDSQVRITKKVDELQETINAINEYTAIPRYPAGLKLLELSVARINNVNSRLMVIHSRLNKIRNIIQLHKQREAQDPNHPNQNKKIGGFVKNILPQQILSNNTPKANAQNTETPKENKPEQTEKSQESNTNASEAKNEQIPSNEEPQKTEEIQQVNEETNQAPAENNQTPEETTQGNEETGEPQKTEENNQSHAEANPAAEQTNEGETNTEAPAEN